MSQDPELLKEFEKTFAEISAGGKLPRPELLGYSRMMRHVHQLEEVMTRVLQAVARNPQIPLPQRPETAYERWERMRVDREFDLLVEDVWNANPNAFGGSNPN